jgi:hypothetical protein
MPRTKSLTALDSQVVSLATQFGSAVAKVVRDNIAAEVAKALRGLSAKNGVAKSGGGGGRGRRQRADGAAVQKRLIDALAGAKKGLRTGELTAKTGIHRGAVEYHLRALRTKRRARVVGTRGKARWFAAK